MITHESLPPLPALVVGEVNHVRHHPMDYAFRHRHYQWLVDLEAPDSSPVWLRWLTRIRSSDHLSGPPTRAALAQEVRSTLTSHGLDGTSATSIIVLTHARTAGHVFDPMSAFYCFDRAGALLAVLVEVHNTYGGRHAYVMTPDAEGRARITKDFAVSPFNAATGTYEARFVLTPRKLSVRIRLVAGDRPVLTAVISGRCRPASTREIVRTALTHPLMTWQVSTLIRLHGIRLWTRLPVPRRTSTSGSAR